MKTNLKKWFALLMVPALVLFVNCSEEEDNVPLESSGNAPGQVQNVQAVDYPGKVKLTYTLPSDENLSYIVARYELENGTEMEVKASYYTNTMLLEGFAGDRSIDVNLYAVNKSEVESKPVSITVTPQRAPVYAVKESLTVGADFGGLRIKADNPEAEDIAILVMQKNEVGDYEPLANSIYTSVKEINQALRGFEAEPQDFAIALRDRWLNYTDTLYTEVTPLFEQLMPKSSYLSARLPNDADSGYPISNLWDGQTFWWWGSYFTERNLDLDSHLVTFDIGQKTKLSRLHIWNFSEPIGGQQLYFYLGAMKSFRIWGANELNDGNLDEWILMGEYNVKKPSGLPYGQENNDDLVAAQDGVDYEISIDKPAVKYLRIECLENWSGTEFMSVSELQVYGNPNN